MRPDVSTTINDIRAHHRERCFAMEQRKRSNLALGAYVRTQLGWSKNLPESDRKRIAIEADALIKTPGDHHLALTIEAVEMARQPFEDIEKASLSAMSAAAQTLPVWEAFGKSIRGFGPASLAVIVAEAGDLSLYSSHSKLWKRMGLAVFDGVRQGGLKKTASKDDWIAHGYNRQRRSRVWNIGDALIKSNGDGVYRATYLARKEFERAKAEAAGLKVAPAAKIQKARAHEFMSDGQIHRRAQRYMEKRLLRKLWQAWRANAAMSEKSKACMPANSFPAQAGALAP
jgi:hypothetical protein